MVEPSHTAQCYKFCAVIGYKRRNSGALPTHVRSTYIQAKGNSIERYQSGLEPDYQHYVKQQLIENFDLEAHAPARKGSERLC